MAGGITVRVRGAETEQTIVTSNLKIPPLAGAGNAGFDAEGNLVAMENSGGGGVLEKRLRVTAEDLRNLFASGGQTIIEPQGENKLTVVISSAWRYHRVDGDFTNSPTEGVFLTHGTNGIGVTGSKIQVTGSLDRYGYLLHAYGETYADITNVGVRLNCYSPVTNDLANGYLDIVVLYKIIDLS